MGEFDPGRYYYSAHHIARDFIATAAPLTLACFAAYAALPPARQSLDRLLSRIPESPNWIILVTAVVAYCLFALVCGALANKAALLIYFILRLSRRRSFDRFYRKVNEPIEAWRHAFLPQNRELWADDETMREETIDRLVSFFQIYNPSGFLGVYREYAFLFMYRQVAAYAVVLFACAFAFQVWPSLLIFLLLFAIATWAVIVSTRECVEVEYRFIVSTGAWLDRERQRIESAPESKQ